MKRDFFKAIRYPAVVLLGVAFLAIPLFGQTTTEKENQQYMYTLQLIPELLDVNNWTEKENKIVGEHFLRLKKFRDEGIVILAGRVPEMDPEGFGIVIFKAGSEEEARTIMENDPAVKNGIMKAKLFPFSVALIQK